MAHFVYLISNESRLVKIGHSNNPRHRIANLATSSPERLAIEHTWKFGERETAAAFEAALHDLFRFARVRREWHETPTEDVVALGDMLIRDEEDLARQIAAELADVLKYQREHRRLWDLARNTSRRWDTETYYERRDAAHDADCKWMAAMDRARALGLPEPEWLRLAGT